MLEMADMHALAHVAMDVLHGTAFRPLPKESRGSGDYLGRHEASQLVVPAEVVGATGLRRPVPVHLQRALQLALWAGTSRQAEHPRQQCAQIRAQVLSLLEGAPAAAQ
jgi:hypothetical protein